MNEREALKLALEALENIAKNATTAYYDDWCGAEAEQALTAIKEALAQPEQEPVYKVTVVDDQHPDGIPLEQWTPEDDMAYRFGGLAQTEQEPVAKYIGEGSEGSLVQLYDDLKKGTDLYTTPPQPEQDNTYVYASSLATAIWQKHYMKDSPKWKPLETTYGVLTQIDNMTCGLVKEKPAQPEQEPAPVAKNESGRITWLVDDWPKDCLLYTTPPQPEQEPVAWIHNFIEGGISIGKRPIDLDRHPDRWTALYKDPKPCPTCEALARTVMLDQTSHDTLPPQRTWVGLTPFEIDEIIEDAIHPMDALLQTMDKLKEKNT